jgi:oxygen-independent coproporphyrinogen-3 oxidase
LEAYSALLIAEADLIADAIGRKLPVAHMHWGGGSPTALPPDRMRAIMQHLRSRFDFLADAEVAVEIDPRTADDESLDAVRDIGCNRASLGVQDFDEKVQAAVNRLQSYAVTKSCADALRARGIDAINLDLIYGLPYQTVPGVSETVSRALDIGPDRVAVFGYAHVPWMKKHQGLLPEHELPGALERWRQREAVDRVITGRGWQAIGLDHYARPEDALATAAAEQTMRRNFQGYTTDNASTLIGIGASSIGSLPQGYAQNAAPMPEYREAVRAGRLPVRRGIALSAEDKLRRDVIEQVMCQGRVDLEATAARHRADAAGLKAAGGRLETLAEDGLVEWDGNVVAVRPEARGFVRTVAAAFDAYFQPQAARHARAI